VAGSTVRGFGLDADQTVRVVDVMASSFNKSALGLENFTESMKYVAPVANAAGASVEETTALLAVLADAGIRGSQAGTSLRKIFTDMTKDGRPLNERLKELGDRGITLADSFDEVGRTAQTSLLVLTKNTEKADALTEAFKGANGEAAAMAKIMSDNLIGDTVKLSSAWEGFILQLTNSRALRQVVQSLTDLVNWLNTSQERTEQQTAAYKDMTRVAKAFISTFGAEIGRDKSLDIWNNKLKEVSTQLEKATKKANELGERSIGTNSLKVQQDYVAALKDQTRLQNYYNDLVNEGGGAIKDAFDKAINGAAKALPIVTQVVDKFKDLKLKFSPDLEAEGSLNPELRNEQAANQFKDFQKGLQDVELQAGATRIALDGVTNSTTQMGQSFTDIGPLLQSTLINGIQLAAEAFGNLLVSTKDFGKNAIIALANFGKQFGMQLIALGVAAKAAQKVAVKPAFAIAAGIALVAISSAASSSLSKSQSNYNGGGGSGGGGSGSVRSIENNQSNLIAGQWVISGRDLKFIMDKNTGLDTQRIP